MEDNVQKPQRVIVVHSPYSGRSDLLSQATDYLQQLGVVVVKSISIATLDDLPPQGPTWMQQGIDMAVAAGGDGLVGGVITHIAECGLPLGILPLGTSNDIARSLRIPQDLISAAQVIAQGKEQQIDIGVARPAEQAPHLATEHQRGPLLEQVPLQMHGFFAHTLTIGMNVQFARIATNVATRKRFGRMNYPHAALEILASPESLDVQLEFERLAMPQAITSIHAQAFSAPAAPELQMPLRCRALQVAIINAPIFGGQWELSIPGTSLSDRLLDIIVIEAIELASLSRFIARFFGPKEKENNAETSLSNNEKQQLTRHPAELSGIPGIHHLQAYGVTITTSADPRDVTLDGEVRGQTPIYVHVADQRLRVRVPGQAGTF